MQHFAHHRLCRAYRTEKQWQLIYSCDGQWLVRVTCVIHNINQWGGKMGSTQCEPIRWHTLHYIRYYIPFNAQTGSSTLGSEKTLNPGCTFSWSLCTHSSWSSSFSTGLTCPSRVLPPSPCCGLSSSNGQHWLFVHHPWPLIFCVRWS